MFEKISKIWDRWSEVGIKMPFLHDPESGKPSETLLFFKAMTTITICSVIALQFQLVTSGIVFTTAGVLIVAFIIYRLRRLDRVKIDVDDQSIELENNDNEEKENTDEKP